MFHVKHLYKTEKIILYKTFASLPD